MNDKAIVLNEIISARRSVFPKSFLQRPIDKSILNQILKNANLAPTHKLTQPWRFKVFRGDSRQILSKFLSDWYKNNTSEEKFLQSKYDKAFSKPMLSDTVIAICMNRSADEIIPEWEEIAAVACAVQNMWLTCTAYGIGSYWSSPKSIEDAAEILELKPDERCLGFFYMGFSEESTIRSKRSAVAEKVQWFE